MINAGTKKKVSWNLMGAEDEANSSI